MTDNTHAPKGTAENPFTQEDVDAVTPDKLGRRNFPSGVYTAGLVFGDWAKFGDRATMEGIHVKRWMTLGNVDGSGRQILIVTDGAQTIVRAGCFKGTPDQFAAKAAAEGKRVYAAMIPAVVAVWAQIDGGAA